MTETGQRGGSDDFAVLDDGLGRKRVLRVVIHEHFAGEVGNDGFLRRLEVCVLEVMRGDLQPVEHEFGAHGVNGAVSESLNDPGDGDLNSLRVFEHGKFEAGEARGGGRFQGVAVEVAIVIIAQGGGSAASAVGFDEFTLSKGHRSP